MANTYTRLIVHIVFAVKYRERLIDESFRSNVEKYICGIISNKKCKPLAIHCNPDHCHILIGFNPAISISQLVQMIKVSSTEYIKEHFWTGGRFAWQAGFGAFSITKDLMPVVVRYILNQPEHHKEQTFRKEYTELLQKSEIDFEEKYLFEFF